jgi:uncharacterized protein
MGIESKTVRIRSLGNEGKFLSAQYNSAGSDPIALVLMFHGITSDRDEWGFYSRMAERFAANNISSIRLDFRGHGASKWPVDDLSLGGFSNDIQSTFEAVKNIEPEWDGPIVLVGTSFGGGLTLNWAKENSDGVSGVFLCAPVFDYQADLVEYTEPMDGKPSSVVYGEEMELPAEILRESLDYRLHAVEVPAGMHVVIFHGDKDSDVPIESSERFKTLNSRVELETVPNSGHGFAAPNDEELEFPQTLENHEKVYRQMVERIEDWTSL